MDSDLRQPSGPAATHGVLTRARFWRRAGSGLLLFALIFVCSFLRTETGAQFLLTRVLHVPGLHIDGVAGRLFGPLRIHRLVYTAKEQVVALTDLQLDWAPAALLRGRVHINALTVHDLTVTRQLDQPVEALSLPEQIALPLRLQVDRVVIEGGALNKGPLRLLTFGALGFKLDFDGTRYLLALDQLSAQGGAADIASSGQVSGQMTLAVRRPYALQGHVQSNAHVILEGQQIGAAGKLTFTGSLAQIDAVADLTVRQTHLRGQAQIRPFAPQPLVVAHLRADAIDLAAWQSGWPQSRLDVRLDAAENGSGTVYVVNHAAGSLDTHQLPLRSAQIDFVQQRDRLRLSAVTALLGSSAQAAGRIDGSGALQNGALQLDLMVQQLALQGLDPRLNATRLDGTVALQHSAGSQHITLALHEPGKRHPLLLSAHASLANAAVEVDHAALQVAGGSVSGTGSVRLDGAQPFQFDGKLARFRVEELGQFNGLAGLELNGAFALRGTRTPQIAAALTFQIDDSLLAGRRLRGNGAVYLHGEVLDVAKFQINAGDNRIDAHGTLSNLAGELNFVLLAPQLAQLGAPFGGALNLSGTARGSLRQPTVTLAWDGSALRLPQALAVRTTQGKASIRIDRHQAFSLHDISLEGSAAGVTTAHQTLEEISAQLIFSTQAQAPLTIRIDGKGANAAGLLAQRFGLVASGTTAQHQLTAIVQNAQQSLRVSAHGGLVTLRPDAYWQGTLDTLQASGAHSASLSAPAAVSLAQQRVILDGLALQIDGTQITVDKFLRDGSGIVTQGRFEHLNAAALLDLVKPAPPLRTDLQFGGDWQLHIAEAVSGRISIQREAGDISLQGSGGVALGLQRLQLQVAATAGKLQAQLQAEGRQLGRIDLSARATAGHAATRFVIIPDAPIEASATMDVPTLTWLGPALAPTLVTAGRMTGALQVQGTLAQPRFRGTLTGNDLRVFWADQGLDLQHGVLDSTFEGERLVIRGLRFENGGGTLAITGPINLAAGLPAAQLALQADHFPLLNRSDRKLVVSGSSEIGWQTQRANIVGRFKVDSGRIDLGRDDAPQLSSDVVVIGRTVPAAGRTVAAVELGIDLGDEFVLTGRGLDARINGALQLSSSGTDALRARGTLKVAQGVYAAYGRKLAIEQGELRFNGPLNNPALNILAMRRGAAVEAGVAVRGTVLVPRVTLVSEPAVSDAEKLSWLVLGKSLDASTGSDVGTLQTAASALLSQGAASGVQSQLASAFGLEDFSLGKSNDSLQQRIVTLGKQISARLYVSYEQGLASASSVVHLRYTLTPKLTLEAEAGTRSALSLFYNVLFD